MTCYGITQYTTYILIIIMQRDGGDKETLCPQGLRKRIAGARRFNSEGSQILLRALTDLIAGARDSSREPSECAARAPASIDTVNNSGVKTNVQTKQTIVFWLQKIIIYAYIA